MSIFGDFITDWQVKRQVVNHLREWMPDYLPHARRQGEEVWGEAFSDFPLPRDYTIVPREPDRWVEDQLPAILVVSTGPTDKPAKNGDGTYRGTFGIGIAAICSAGSEELVGLFADLYFSAAASILLDKPSLGGFAQSTVIAGAPDNVFLAVERNRTLASRFCDFEIQVDRILEITGGPLEHLIDPDTDPGDWETVETHDVEVVKQ